MKDRIEEILSNLLHNKKHLASILFLGILILAIPIGMELLKNQRIIRSRATGEPIVFVESDDVFQKDGKWFTKTKNVSVQITSPLGPPAQPVSSPPTNTSEHVYILEVDDSVDTQDGILTNKATKLFYKKYPDKYDFLVFFPGFQPKNDLKITAQHGRVQNNVRGICTRIEVSDLEFWGSQRLKGVSDFSYGNSDFAEWIGDPVTSGNLLLHETGHQWLTSLGQPVYNDPDGSLPDGLNKSCGETNLPWQFSSRDYGHWSNGLQMPLGAAGVMYGGLPWVDNGDGTFSYETTTIDKLHKFHPFDLYLMGLIDKKEINSSYLLLDDVSSLEGPPPILDLKVHLRSVKSTAHRVTIEDLIKTSGEERTPGVETSQKDFTTAFVILTKAGQQPSKILVKAIQEAANAFPDQWAYATDNRSTMNKKF